MILQIIIFCKNFKIFSNKFKFPKLHSWKYHIIDSIKSFGSINGFTTDTFETFHKFYVKEPYKLSNKKNTSLQMLIMVSWL